MRRITCTFILSLAIVLGASLADAQGPTKLDHGASTTWFGHVPLMVAIDRGYFKEAGLDVELKPIVKSSDRMLALTQGGIVPESPALSPGLTSSSSTVVGSVMGKKIGELAAKTRRA